MFGACAWRNAMHIHQTVVVVCDCSRTLHGTQYTHHSLKYLLPQHRKSCNDVFLLINPQENCSFSKAQHKLPEDGPGGPKHVGASIEIF